MIDNPETKPSGSSMVRSC